KMLDRFEYTTPGTMGRIVTFPEQLVFQAGERVKERPPVPCERCGDPSVSGLCQACRLLESINGAPR
ncbi:MAG: hypothetical protein LUO93_10990, partial [Methanomicrobiales archaeon]|nr:hypothetical protein [Methanomicrobiales archaeon]